ncbi:MAG: glycerol kinase, partial [Atopobiaceae bacterium]|nr:glycerol kinase [Atopobiaceae bacterium]
LMCGTVDTSLVWVLTGGLGHATDVTNASRTMLVNIHEGCWDPWLLELFDIPASMRPEVRPSSGSFGETSYPGLPAGIPIAGVAGDQRAALFGQCCFEAGQAKNTYGTGCFMLLHTGHEAVASKNSLVTTIAASAPGTEGLEYALEGSVFVGGAVVQWLRDEVGLIRSAAETEYLAKSVGDTGGVYLVPAFTGLGAPWWAPDARGTIFGITRGTGVAHIVRAALESIAYQVSDLAVAMEADAGKPIEVLNVDGGASANSFLMQFESDILDRTLARPQNRETTAMGAAYLAGLATGFWSGTDELHALRSSDDNFTPKMDAEKREELLAGWHEAIRRTI